MEVVFNGNIYKKAIPMFGLWQIIMKSFLGKESVKE
jgi:hypothetical protein